MGKPMNYNLAPMPVNKEAARFDTCVRQSQGFKLDRTNLGRDYLPSLAPIYVDFANKKAYPIVNMEVYEAYTNGADALTIKVKKGSGVSVGMFIGNGSKGAEVSAVDKSNAAYDVITISAAFGSNIAAKAVLFQASAVSGTTQKYKANQLNYAPAKNEDGATVTGIISIYEIHTSKIDYPFSAKDKESLGDRFQFID